MSQTTALVEVLPCRSCGIPLGSTDRRRLWLGACGIERTVTLLCLGCGTLQHWSPEPAGYSERRRRRCEVQAVLQS